MTKIPSVEETEETAKATIEKVRHYATPHQHPDNSAEAKAYLEGVNTAMAMLYIDLTGTPKVKGFLTTYAETQRLALLTELRGWTEIQIKALLIIANKLGEVSKDNVFGANMHWLLTQPPDTMTDQIIKQYE